MPRESAFWCFTLNNPTEDQEQHVTDFLSSSDCDYGIFGREVGESGTPHLQGFVILSRSRRLSFLRRKFQAHWTVRHPTSTNTAARNYCRKDGDYEEFGTFREPHPGRRTDLEVLIDWADEFEREHGRPASFPDIVKYQPRAYLKYPRFRALCAHRATPRRLEFGEPKEWQSALRDELSNEPDDRTIKFIVDPEGGKGKTWFCRWMLTEQPESVQIHSVGGFTNIAHMVDETKHIYLFNIGRGQMEHLCYPILEALKDRLLQSPKYHGRRLTWTRNTHVVVLSNEEPDYTKLTADRYDVVNM